MNSLKGYHRIVFSDGRCEDMVIVELDARGRYVSHHPFQEEEPFVEWVGGTMTIDH